MKKPTPKRFTAYKATATTEIVFIYDAKTKLVAPFGSFAELAKHTAEHMNANGCANTLHCGRPSDYKMAPRAEWKPL